MPALTGARQIPVNGHLFFCYPFAGHILACGANLDGLKIDLGG